MSTNGPVSYRGCEIFIGPDHRGRKQFWVSIPGRYGAERFACHTIEDGKAAIDAHFDAHSDNMNSRWAVVGILVAGGVLLVILLGLGAG